MAKTLEQAFSVSTSKGFFVFTATHELEKKKKYGILSSSEKIH
jgi:hypothetical protein